MNKKTDARSLNRKALEDLRRRVVAAIVEQGCSKTEAARLFGVSRTSVHHWVQLYQRRGEPGLTPKRPGRPRQSGRLKGWQAATIVRLIRHRTPEELGLSYSLWTREAVGQLLAQRCGVHYSVWSVGRLLRRWNFTPQKPVQRAYERQPQEIRQWLEEDYPEIRDRAAQEGAEIHWADQTGFRSHQRSGRSYGRRGQTPVVRGPGKRFGCNVMSTITNAGRLSFLVFTENFCGDVMLRFLEHLVHRARRKIFLILDSHPVHLSGPVEAWLAAHKAQLEAFFLPKYAPELNPTELLNQDAKANALQFGRPHNRDEMVSDVSSYLRSTQLRPDIVRAYFEEPHVQYAAAL